MKIALTGFNGFIGSHLVKKLKEQPDLELSFLNRERYSLFNVPSLKSFVEDKDVIVHLAGVKRSTNIEELYRVNFLGTANLLEAIFLFGKQGAHFLFPSSFLVYRESRDSKKLLGEKNSLTLPQDHYGLSKLLAEKIIAFYSRKKQIKAAVLRIANVYGPVLKGKSDSVVNLFVEGIRNNLPVTIRGGPKTVRDLIYIKDVVEAFLKIIENQKKNFLLINICTGKATKMINLIKLIEGNLHKKAILQYDKKFNEKAYWIGDKTLALKEIKFKAETDIRIGVKKTVEWYNERN